MLSVHAETETECADVHTALLDAARRHDDVCLLTARLTGRRQPAEADTR
jgi:hypothetical protein